MGYIFLNCSNVKELDLTNWDTSKATVMTEMFCYTTRLEIVKVGKGWKTSKANTSAVFAGSKIKEVTLVENN